MNFSLKPREGGGSLARRDSVNSRAGHMDTHQKYIQVSVIPHTAPLLSDNNAPRYHSHC